MSLFKSGDKVKINPNVDMEALHHWIGGGYFTIEQIGTGVIRGQADRTYISVYFNSIGVNWNMKREFLVLVEPKVKCHPLTTIFKEKACA